MGAKTAADQRADVIRLRAEIDQLTLERDRLERRLVTANESVAVLRTELANMQSAGACPTCKLHIAESTRWKRVATELNDRLLAMQADSITRDSMTMPKVRLRAW